MSLEGVSLSTIDVPLTKTVYRHIEARDFHKAHAVACLGVTQVRSVLVRVPSFVIFAGLQTMCVLRPCRLF